MDLFSHMYCVLIFSILKVKSFSNKVQYYFVHFKIPLFIIHPSTNRHHPPQNKDLFTRLKKIFSIRKFICQYDLNGCLVPLKLTDQDAQWRIYIFSQVRSRYSWTTLKRSCLICVGCYGHSRMIFISITFNYNFNL